MRKTRSAFAIALIARKVAVQHFAQTWPHQLIHLYFGVAHQIHMSKPQARAADVSKLRFVETVARPFGLAWQRILQSIGFGWVVLTNG